MATYSPKEYAAHLAVYETLRMADKRIFDNGKDGNNNDIGTYSPKPLYVSLTSAHTRKKPTPGGKDSKNRLFKNGKPRRSGYFANYTAFKSDQGINTLGGKVNLQITKHFRRAFLTKAFPISVKGSLILVDIGVKPSTANPIGKLHGLMLHKYPQAFKFTPFEKNFLLNEVKQIFLDELRA
jgi:hypothetical protein